jgi:methylphosphonate synthase
MHQFTYFIGDVNYYYQGPDGEKKVAVMNTGDSVYGAPFRPHSFATRKGASKNGLILALTYGNNLLISQQELSTLGVELGLNFYLDFSSKERAFSSLLKFNRENMSLTHEEFAKRSGIPKETIEGLENSITSLPDDEMLSKLAKALNVNVRDLYPPDSIEDKVIVRYHKDAPRWFYPESKAYEIVELAHSRYLPFSKALEFNIKKGENDQILDIKMGLHQYIYNVGDSPVEFNWKINNIMNHEKINPGDSIYVKPFVPHNFRGNGKLMVLRIAGRIAGDAQRELSTLDKNDAHRAILETSMWFDPKGKN